MASHLFRTAIGLLLGVASAVSAASELASIRNWSAPASWSPASGKTGSARPLSAQSDLTGALPFVAVTPCRRYDSRNTSALADNTPRTISLSGAPCGIPSSAGAISVNITVFSIAGAAGNGVFKVGVSSPPTTSWINYPPSETQRANAGVVSVTSGNIVVQVNQGGGSVQFTVDVNGYYVSTLNSGEQLLITASAGSGAIRGVNASGDGVQGETAGAGSSGVYGNNTGGGKGVFGASGGGNGVEGQSTGGSGVRGDSASGPGVSGQSNSNGVEGHTTGSASGVYGATDSGSGYGVAGRAGAGSQLLAATDTGVLGDSDGGYGVLGLSLHGDGVHGEATGAGLSGVAGIDASGATLSTHGVYGGSDHGYAVFAQTIDGYALYGDGNAYVSGSLVVAGLKAFVMPHPTDPDKQIAFLCMEGPESGTYFRGTAHLVGGYAEVPVPESFRLVTSERGLTAVATPVGAPASIYCVSKTLDKIVFQGSHDVDFDYVVGGVRSGLDGYQPIQKNTAFVPRNASDDSLTRLPIETVRRLKTSGVLKEDGSINEDTAHRLGWDQRAGWNRTLRTPEGETRSAQVSN